MNFLKRKEISNTKEVELGYSILNFPNKDNKVLYINMLCGS